MHAGEFGDRVALVTGGSGGIGAALCLRLGAAGAAVALHYATSKEAAEGIADRIAEAGGRAAVFGADLRDAGAPAQLVDAVEAELGPVDLLTANAGLSRPGSYEEVDADAFDETLAVNLRAPYLLVRRVLPGMRERRFGRILFTSSVAALTGGIVGPHYASSKATAEERRTLATAMRTLGIDLAAQPRKTGLCLIDWSGAPRLKKLVIGRLDGEPLDNARLIREIRSADKTKLRKPSDRRDESNEKR